jgi:hypothetical protein
VRWRMPGLPSLPGPLRWSFWHRLIRGPWLTSVFGLMLLATIPVKFVTGLLSYAAYNPDLSSVNDTTPGKGLFGFYLFSWPTHPVWLYRLNQGVQVTLGLARGDRSPVPAVRRRARPATAHRPLGPAGSACIRPGSRQSAAGRNSRSSGTAGGLGATTVRLRQVRRRPSMTLMQCRCRPADAPRPDYC